MPTLTAPQCTRCTIPLQRRNHPVFRGTVLAVGSHDCDLAKKILTQAATAARLFATEEKVIHVRYISPIITEQSWIATLQKSTTTHDLEHRTIPLGGAGSFVVSYRAGEVIDMAMVAGRIKAELEALGDRRGPERIISVLESGKSRRVYTHSGSIAY